jgi:predicted dienelactone hydrolase
MTTLFRSLVTMAFLAGPSGDAHALPAAPDQGAAGSPPVIGYTTLRAEDPARSRPVLIDLWYPAAPGAVEAERDHGMARGRSALDAPVAGGAHPLVLLSHGAFGAARNYTWIAEHLARRGFVVAGISHYRESPAYGPETIDPAAALRLWQRPMDVSFAIGHLLGHPRFGPGIDPGRIGAVGHSSGGTTVLALAGALFDPGAMARYCASEGARADRGCGYGRGAPTSATPPPEARRSHRDERVRAIVALDPAVGPGHDPGAIAIPVHVIGAVDNDFLPYEAHAGHYARLTPGASLTPLTAGEGHFVFLDVCRWDREAMGVPLCRDRAGVDRGQVHERLAAVITGFLDRELRKVNGGP